MGKVVVLDGREMELGDRLYRMGFDVIYTERCDDLYPAISYHPDIILHPLKNNKVVVAPNVSKNFINKLLERGFDVIIGETYLKRNYPFNIAYNVARIGNLAFHNSKYTDKILRSELEKEGVKFVHVNQGYTKCSIAVLGNKAIITSDMGIYKVTKREGLDALLIRPGFIELEGMEYGFIGGATGLVTSNTLVFTGKIDFHPDKEKIIDFLNMHKIKYIEISEKRLKDVGTVMLLGGPFE